MVDEIPKTATFIPRSFAATRMEPTREPVSLLFVLGIVTISLALITHGGAYLYKYYLEKNLVTLESSLEKARGAFDPNTLTELTRTEKRLRAASTLVNKHTTLRPLFALFDANTLRNVRFKSFTINQGSDKTMVNLKVSGEASSYAAIALQSDKFSETGKMSGLVFSDLNLSTFGNVIFSMQAKIDPSLVSYRNNLTQTNQ
ncbi:MAG: hypothetical protein AAB682_00010 [Patescibacteria group bacterium]